MLLFLIPCVLVALLPPVGWYRLRKKCSVVKWVILYRLFYIPHCFFVLISGFGIVECTLKYPVLLCRKTVKFSELNQFKRHMIRDNLRSRIPLSTWTNWWTNSKSLANLSHVSCTNALGKDMKPFIFHASHLWFISQDGLISLALANKQSERKKSLNLKPRKNWKETLFIFFSQRSWQFTDDKENKSVWMYNSLRPKKTLN